MFVHYSTTAPAASSDIGPQNDACTQLLPCLGGAQSLSPCPIIRTSRRTLLSLFILPSHSRLLPLVTVDPGF